MGKIIDKRFEGSTLIEVITASIIFLIVFIASFTILSRLIPADNDAVERIDADYRVSTTFRELADGLHEDGKYAAKYSWGEVDASLEPYSEYADLQQLCITVSLRKSKKRIVYKYVVERKR